MYCCPSTQTTDLPLHHAPTNGSSHFILASFPLSSLYLSTSFFLTPFQLSPTVILTSLLAFLSPPPFSSLSSLFKWLPSTVRLSPNTPQEKARISPDHE